MPRILPHQNPTGNLLPEKLFKTDLFVKHNQTTEYGTMRYSYDGFGRMLTREGHQGFEKQRFHYDSESRITKIELLNHGHLKAVEFEYDPLGRRIEKRAIPKEDFHQTETTSFGWVGMQMVHESNDKTKNNCLYIYNDGSYEPLARIEKHDDDDATAEKISYYSNHINGCPDAMLDDDGNIVWIAKITTFGKAEKELKVDRIEVQQNLRYQGQYLDRETGLHYNTFRYYDPEIGRFTQQDPIGLAGGFNLYQYAPNMIHWIDPWGWAKLFEIGTYGSLNGSDHVRDQLQGHELIRHEYLNQKGLANSRLSGNPSIALDLNHHTRGPIKDTRGIGGAHWHENRIREQQGLKVNEFASSNKRELDITQGALRKAGVPASRARKLRKMSNKFLKSLCKKQGKGV